MFDRHVVSVAKIPALPREGLDARDHLYQCYREARRSPDPSTQNGAVLLDANHFPLGAGCNHIPETLAKAPEYWADRDTKLKYVVHAERAAIFDAARQGVGPTEGSTLVCSWAPCWACAQAIAAAGCVRLVTHKQMMDRSRPDWLGEIVRAVEFLGEAGVDFVLWDGKVCDEEPGGEYPPFQVRMNGQHWIP